jgi:hypothetical protein
MTRRQMMQACAAIVPTYLFQSNNARPVTRSVADRIKAAEERVLYGELTLMKLERLSIPTE